jgi:nicotinamidase-related amidase
VIYLTKERHPSLPWPDHAPIYRSAHTPILVHGTWGADVVEQIKPSETDIVLPRFTSIDPSHGTALWSILRNLSVETVILAGVSTTLAVEGTARAAANRGYRVVVLENCCASVPDEWHRFSVENILPLIAEVTTSARIAT